MTFCDGEIEMKDLARLTSSSVFRSAAVGAVISLYTCLPLIAYAGEDNELYLQPSPDAPRVLQLSAAESVLDTDVSPSNPVAAVLVRTAKSQILRFWNFSDNRITASVPIPTDVKVGAIAWHPRGEWLYATTHLGNDWQIVRLAHDAKEWRPAVLYRASVPIRRLVFSRQRFEASYLTKSKAAEYRLYFGAQATNGKWETRTIRESGDSPYTLAGPTPALMPPAEKSESNSKGNQFTLPSALPASFHGSGNTLLIQDEQSCYAELYFSNNFDDNYHKDDWTDPQKLVWNERLLCGGSLTYTPNGTGFFQWRKGEAGLIYLNRKSGVEKNVAGEIQFISTPSSTADGKGVVGVTQATGKAQQLEYIPTDVPLGDVLNAWMFIEQADELKLYSKNGGVLRSANYGDQLFRLYDEENYGNCGSYPKRPYLITSDLFWENFGAAFESVFILNERYQAIPSFQKVVAETNKIYSQNKAPHRLAKVFSVAAHILDPMSLAGPDVVKEAADVLAGSSAAQADLLGEPVSYNQFRPRGHYVKTEENRRYFAAMRYLTSVHLTADEAKLITELPASVQQQAKIWIDAYRPFIAAPRAPVAWKDVPIALSRNVQKPLDKPSLFPLSWARDNETFYNTTSHVGEAEPLGEEYRVMPSGLDIAFVFGSAYAKQSLANELTRYPRLEKRLDKLRLEMGAQTTNEDSSLYDLWLSGLAQQWDSRIVETDALSLRALDVSSKELWSAKRLQTGLASWATLRHTTVLVNDQSAAEGGQGGFSFEPLVLPPPRGYVEPDPQTFQTIENLYAKLIATLNTTAVAWPKDAATQELHRGVIAQLANTRLLVGRFRTMATKLVQGKTLSDEEYKTIENVGGLVEHDFLLMKSVQVGGYGLAEPDPISKIADVAHAPGASLEVAVGKPAEWDQIVPFHGKRELVRGSVYSYYEFASGHPLTDDEWRQSEEQTSRPAWIQPFFVGKHMGCPNLQK